ncbi:MAG: YdcF family protein [Eubacterium sp.]|nr:YdcF family protein [Eubacterium sp.]
MKNLSGLIIWSVLGILCIIYGLIVSRTGSGTGFFLVWIALGILALLLAAACRMQIWSRLPGILRTAAMILLLVFLAVFTIVQGKIVSRFHSAGKPDLDVVIVLGAQVYDYGPSRVLRNRLDTAAAYLKDNEGTMCIVSGGQGYNEPAPEAEIMKQYLTEQGIVPERIIIENQSRNTVENIRLSMKLMDPEQDYTGIVTNNFHVYRGCAIAEKTGIRHVCGLAAPSNRLYLPNNLLREFFGVVKDWLAGNMDLKD